MTAKIHSIKLGQADQYNNLLKSINATLRENLSELISQMFNDADDVLFKLAENAESNESQNQYFDTMRLLRLERQNIRNDFLEEIDNLFSSKNQTLTDFEDDELSLVDQEAMEEIVAISTMDSKAMNLYGETVKHIEARLEIILTKSDHSFVKDTLSPKHICEALQTSFQTTSINTNNKLILYKLFDQKVCSKLGGTYDTINKILIDKGILPEFKANHKITNTTPEIHARTYLNNDETVDSEQYIDPSIHAYTESNSVQSTSFPSLCHHQNDRIYAAAYNFIHDNFINNDTCSDKSETHYYDKRDILSALTNLQSNFTASTQSNKANTSELKNTLLSDLGKNNGGIISKQVDRVNEKTIELIELLFDEIYTHGDLSQVMNNLILRLQIPIVKVAMLDEEFFKIADHPARKFLDKLCFAGKSVSNITDDIYTELDCVVNTLLQDYNFDLVSFQKAIDKLNIIINDMQSKLHDNEQKTQKSVLNNHAKDIVLNELKLHTKNMQLPKSAQPIVLKHWATLMFNQYIHYGKDSKHWIESVVTLKSLILSIQPIQDASEHSLLINNHIDFLDKLKTSLFNTKQSKEDISSSLNSLLDIYNNMIDGFTANTSSFEADELKDKTDSIDNYYTDTIDNTLLESINEQSVASQSSIDLLPDEVKPGVWFEIFTSNETPKRRLKLSLILMEEAKLIFVDRTGKKVIEKDAETFTQELSINKSNIIADHSTFNHALSRVITSLAANG